MTLPLFESMIEEQSRDPDPLHRHRPKNFPRHQPRRRRSLSKRHALAEDAGVQGEEHPGVSRLKHSRHV